MQGAGEGLGCGQGVLLVPPALPVPSGFRCPECLVAFLQRPCRLGTEQAQKLLQRGADRAWPSHAPSCDFVGREVAAFPPHPILPPHPIAFTASLLHCNILREGMSHSSVVLLQESPGLIIISGKKMLRSDLNADMGL